MSERTYPRTVWVLTPSFRPKSVQVVKPYASYSHRDYGDLTESGKIYAAAEMYAGKAEAIASGRERLAEQRAKLEKMMVTLNKRGAALDKAGAA